MTVSKRTLTVLAAAALSSVAFAGPVLAQTTAPTAMQATDAQLTNHWRASKLNGVNVYNNANEKIGEIDELLMDAKGQVDAVVVEVGGFLGMGKHHVALKFNDVKFSDAPMSAAGSAAKTTTTTTTTENRTGTTVSTASTRNTRMYPDHAVVNMTKDQLKALPEVKYER
jgi:sporulation protein YlmC with PRC-barrel domain